MSLIQVIVIDLSPGNSDLTPNISRKIKCEAPGLQIKGCVHSAISHIHSYSSQCYSVPWALNH